MTVPSQASAAPLSTSSPTRSAPMFFARFAAVFALFFVVLSALAIGPIPAARAADWPTYRHDINRTNASDEPLAFPLRLAWSYTCAQAPEPAWPEQLYLLNRVDFDYAPAPVVAGGLMIFGSTSDDAVHALDAATGVEKWHFITGGPVRFSPQIVGDKVYAASDDGYVYCLNASTGKAVWSFRGGPVDERLVGNHRMISRWPMRNGLLVDAGMLFCVAGTWGSEGVFVYALKAETGEVIWCRDTSGVGGMGMTDFVGMGINPQHQGEFGISGANPQGPMVANERVLIVPNGFAAPMSYDRATGNGGGVGGGPAGTGGTWLAIDGSRLYCFSKHGQRQNVLNVQDYDLVSGKAGRGWRTPAIPWLSIAPQIKPEEIHAKGKVSILAHKGNYARQAYQLAKAGAELIVGQDGYVAAETEAQKEIWRAPVEGEAREIAVADGRLYVATDRGVIYCYESAGKGGEKPAVRHDPGAAFRAKAAGAENDDSKLVSSVPGWGVKQLLASHIDRGFAMVVCDADGSVSEALAGQSQLRVINVQTDSAVAAALRERLLAETNWHGSRIHVQVVERLDKLPFAQFFANAVIVASPLDAAKGDAGAVAKELYRVLRPCGGVLVAPGLKPEQASALAAECGATDAERTAKASTKDDVKSADRPLVIRGKLPGALDWDSPKEITADQRVKWPLRPLWFGGPTSLQTHNFRQGADGPTLANGRSFIMGEDSLTAVDAYNGEVLWSRPIPKENGDIRSVDGLLFGASEAKPYGKQDFARSLRVNDDTVYLALGAAYLRGRSATIEIDARTGVQRRVYGAYIPPTPVGLASARTWPIDVDAHRSGTVTLEKTAAGLVVTLVTKNPAPANIDAWELFFDLRPFDARYGLYDHGAFHLRVTPARAKGIAATWSHGTETQYMLEYPEISVAGEAVAGGSKTVVTLPWAGLEKLEKLAGWKPSSFGFAATLNVNDGKRDEPFVRRHLFCDWAADGINNGWAKVTLDGNEDGIAGAKTQPAAAPGTQPAFAAPPTIMAAMRKFNAAALRKGGAAIAPSV
ncbi:MAG: PQQ-binding-like beta-propeller repeat protein, partial [Planctomycetota bacterium]|nr:PQQ-binding-like beta-propeller repeat protein [Planctomycetota bacterium]